MVIATDDSCHWVNQSGDLCCTNQHYVYILIYQVCINYYLILDTKAGHLHLVLQDHLLKDHIPTRPRAKNWNFPYSEDHDALILLL